MSGQWSPQHSLSKEIVRPRPTVKIARSQQYACIEMGSAWRIVHDHEFVPFYMDGTFRLSVVQLCRTDFGSSDDKNLSRKTHPALGRVPSQNFQRLTLHFSQLLA